MTLDMLQNSPSLYKERKKSAHWSDDQTNALVDILLRYKDSGRTPDNGFKPEVWREASSLLDKTTYMGGPKTTEACKSRWQRIQRDYRAAKDMASMPGIRWDRTEGRLIGEQGAWEAAEMQLEPYKYGKIHLSCYDTLALLCPDEIIRSRGRNGKARSSLASTSDSSSMLSLSLTAGSSSQHLDEMSATTSLSGHTQSQGHGHSHGHSHQHGQMQMTGMEAHLQQGMGQMDTSMMSWDGSTEDGDGEYDTFTLPDGTPHPFSLHMQKRLQFDPTAMMGHTQPNPNNAMPGPSPPKKPRTAPVRTIQTSQSHQQLYAMTLPRSPDYSTHHSHPGLLDPAILTPKYQMMPTHTNSAHPQQQIQVLAQESSSSNHTHPHSHSHNQAPSHPQPNTLHSNSMSSQNPAQSQATNQDHLQPPTQNHNVSQPHTPLQSTIHQQQLHPQSQQLLTPATQNQNQNQHQPQNPNPGQNPNSDFPSYPSPLYVVPPEVRAASYPDSVRRTEAILHLQREESELRDEELVEVIAEFEENVVAADTYMAIKKQGLRRLWLTKLLTRRKG